VKTWTTLIAVAAALVVCASASAHRLAVRAEKVAMMYNAGSHYAGLSANAVDAPRAYPLRCAIADIATVVKGSRWGGWAFNPSRAHDRGCARWGSNGWVIEHKIGKRWYVLAEGSELPGHVAGVPHRVALDLVKGMG
jgi:hypothetical protein